jgi:hypothetical protein
MAMNKYVNEQWKMTLTKSEWEEIIREACSVDTETLEACGCN